MRILSLWQPWAELMRGGAKQCETRSWGTDYRGWVALHAAKRWTRSQKELCYTEPFRTTLLELKGRGATDPEPQDFGGVVAVAWLDDVLTVGSDVFPPLSGTEKPFGDYTSGRKVWLFSDLHSLERPLLLRGHQGLWTPSSSEWRQITELAGLLAEVSP